MYEYRLMVILSISRYLIIIIIFFFFLTCGWFLYSVENYALATLTLPTSLVIIDDYAFFYCYDLNPVIIPT